MQLVSSPQLISELLNAARVKGLTIGLVPTMGALHQGHASLIAAAKGENAISVVSVFINRLQFNNQEDFEKYPRVLDEDIAFLKTQGVDYVYAPAESEMYPDPPITQINFGSMTNLMEGKYRIGHFEGVGLVVNKLLNQTLPNRAYFGLKDLQQFLIVKRMVHDFSIATEIVGLPIIREASGLAMSSRNRRLTRQGEATAANIYAGLVKSKDLLAEGKSISETKRWVTNFYEQVVGFDLEYFEFVNPTDLCPYPEEQSPNELAICIAGYVEGIRLIDNLYLRPD